MEMDTDPMKLNPADSRAFFRKRKRVVTHQYIKWALFHAFSLAAILIAAFPVLSGDTMNEKTEYIVYVGTYTDGSSEGIYGYRFQPETGTVTPIGLVADSVNPSFLAIHPNRRFLYAANEVSSYDGNNGYVSAFRIDPETGRLTLMNRVSSEGTHPCHIAVDKTGKWLLAANYTSGSISVLPIKDDGSLGEASQTVRHSGSGINKMRQEGPHAHSVNLSPDNRFLLVTDLGIDKVVIYRFDAVKGTLEANDPPFFKLHPGAGPRHLSFHPDGRRVYLINELDSSLTALSFDPAKGSLQEIGTVSTLPDSFTGFSTTAEVEVHPDGRYVYGSNRGHDSVTVFRIEESQGTAETISFISTEGKNPRHFAIDPTGGYLFAANQDSDSIVLFRIDRKSGGLTETGTVLQTSKPVCVVFLPVR
jgi:6-phosphogluconolactonase